MRFLLTAALFAGTLHSAALSTLSIPSFFFYEENVGQADPNVRLLIRGGPQRAYFSDRSIHLFNGPTEAAVRFAAEDATPAFRPIDVWSVVVNRFEGGEQAWRRNIPVYSKVEFAAIYPGVDLIAHESAGRPVFTYVIQPGADPAMVVLDAGQARGRLNEQGDWLVEVSFGSSTFKKPRAYQQAVGITTAVEISFVEMSMSQVRLQAQSFDSSRPLFVDVDLVSGESGQSVAVSPLIDSAGNTYFTGELQSSAVCSVTPFGTNFCPDAFVAGIDSQHRPLFFTVLAGAAEDSARFLAMDSEGKLVITGNTASDNFPVTADAFQNANAGPIGPRPRTAIGNYGDLFFARLDPVDGNLLHSTFYGGPRGEAPRAVAAEGAAGIAVLTFVDDEFPTTAGAWFRDAAGFCANCPFMGVVRFDALSSRPLFATFVPGNASTIAMHSDASVYVAGWTSTEAPTTAGALQPEWNGGQDAYLVRLAADGSRPVFATYFGASGAESFDSIVVDDSGDAWVHGESYSPELTSSARASFLARISADGARLLGSEFYAFDSSGRLLRDPAGKILLYSNTYSPVLAVAATAVLGGGCGNNYGHAYLRRFLGDGSLDFASYLPGSADSGAAVAIGPDGAFHRYSPAGTERVALDTPTGFSLGCVTSAASRWNFSRISPGTVITLIGTQMGPETGVGAAPADGRYPDTLAGVRVWINDIPAPLLHVQAGQINAVTPYGVTPGTPAEVVVDYQGGRAALGVEVVPYDFALFSLDGSGLGQAAALNQDGSINSIDNPAPRGSIVVLYGTGAGVTVPPSTDGALAPLADFPEPAEPIQVLFNRAYTEVLYAGSAPGLVNGVVQINMRIPEDLPADPAEIPINVVIGGSQYVSPATIAIR